MHANDAQAKVMPKLADGNAAPRWGLAPWKAFAGLVLVLLAAYMPAIRGDFVITEDQMLAANPLMQSVTGLARFWTAADTEQYQPLTYTSLWLEWRLWGPRPWGYRMTNVILHAVNALLVLLLLRRIGVRGAFAAAAVFALHPVNVESVAWIYERKNVLSGLFFLLTFLAMLHFDEGGSWKWYAGAVLLYAAALLSKSSAVALPVILLLYWWWKRRLWRPRVLAVGPLIVMALFTGILAVYYEQHYAGATGPEFTAGIAERAARAGWLVAFYLHKFFVPLRLMFFYPRIDVDPSTAIAWAPDIVIVLVLLACLVFKQSWGRPLFFALASYLVALFPVLGFFNLQYQRFSDTADHFLYLPMMALCGLCAHVVVLLLERLGLLTTSDTTRGGHLRGSAVGTIVVAACWLLTYQRAGLYKNSAALCEETLRYAPSSWIAHELLGEHLLRQVGAISDQQARTRQIESAVSHLEQSIAFHPDNGRARVNLGIGLASLGRQDEALEQLRRAVVISPTDADCHYNLASLLHATGELEGAAKEYQIALRYQPGLWKARVSLGKVLVATGRADEGVAELRRADRDSGQALPARLALGSMLCLTGYADEGLQIMRVLLREHPQDPSVRAALGELKAISDRVRAARTQPAP